MRLAVFTDIHGNLQALESILKSINSKNYDEVIFLGDSIGLGVDNEECLNLIKNSNIKFLMGNHEYYYIKGVENIKGLKKDRIFHDDWVNKRIKTKLNNLDYEYEIVINNIKLTFLHFFLIDNIDYPFENLSIFDSNEYKNVFNKIDSDYVFYGHIHDERLDVINNKKYYGLNSSGCVKDDNTFYYEINIDKKVEVNKINLKFDRKAFENNILKYDFPDKENILKKYYGL